MDDSDVYAIYFGVVGGIFGLWLLIECFKPVSSWDTASIGQ